MPTPDLSSITRTMDECVTETGDDIHLILGGKDDGTYSASLVCPVWGSGFAPLFDPVNGEECLAATGETPAAALAALAALLNKYAA